MVVAPDALSLLDTQEEGFDPYSYLDTFGGYRWTYIVGYREILDKLLLAEDDFRRLRALKDYVKGLRGRAIDTVPFAWKELYPEGDWEHFNETQMHAAFDGEPMRFDKALLALSTLDLAVKSSRSSEFRQLDIYSLVRLRPAIYVLRSLDDKARAFLTRNKPTDLEADLFKQLIYQLCPPGLAYVRTNREVAATKFLLWVALGYGMTWRNATIICKFINDLEIGTNRAMIASLQDRTDGGTMKGKKSCNLGEDAFVGLDANGLAALTEFDPEASSKKGRRAL